MAEISEFWRRLVAILDTENPNDMAFLTGRSYSQLTRYKSGASGARGPSASALQGIAETIEKRTGRRVTMGQLWGTEPLTPALSRAQSKPPAQGIDQSAKNRQDGLPK